MIGNKNICLFVYMQIISHDTLQGKTGHYENEKENGRHALEKLSPGKKKFCLRLTDISYI
jgi:hypothetical protein